MSSLSGSYAVRHWPRVLLFIAMLAVGVLAPFAGFGYIDADAYLLLTAVYFFIVGAWFRWPARSGSD